MAQDSVQNTTSAERQAMEEQAKWDHYEAKMAELEERARKKGPKALKKFQDLSEEDRIRMYNRLGKAAKKLQKDRTKWDRIKIFMGASFAALLAYLVVGGIIVNIVRMAT